MKMASAGASCGRLSAFLLWRLRGWGVGLWVLGWLWLSMPASVPRSLVRDEGGGRRPAVPGSGEALNPAGCFPFASRFWKSPVQGLWWEWILEVNLESGGKGWAQRNRLGALEGALCICDKGGPAYWERGDTSELHHVTPQCTTDPVSLDTSQPCSKGLLERLIYIKITTVGRWLWLGAGWGRTRGV